MRVRNSKGLKLVPTAAPGPGSGQPALRVPGLSARLHLIEVAIRLFCRNGIGATGVEAIVAQSGVARMTLYNHFGSKDALVAAALAHEGSVWRAWFFARLAMAEGTPRERLLVIFDAIGEWFAREDYFGCALMNAVAEYRNDNPAVLEVTLAHKRQVLEYIEGLCAGAGAPDPKALTGQIDLLMDGAIVKALVSRRTDPAFEAKAILSLVLEQAMPKQ
jgi:AcrR family transcriptional regulator